MLRIVMPHWWRSRAIYYHHHEISGNGGVNCTTNGKTSFFAILSDETRVLLIVHRRARVDVGQLSNHPTQIQSTSHSKNRKVLRKHKIIPNFDYCIYLVFYRWPLGRNFIIHSLLVRDIVKNGQSILIHEVFMSAISRNL